MTTRFETGDVACLLVADGARAGPATTTDGPAMPAMQHCARAPHGSLLLQAQRRCARLSGWRRTWATVAEDQRAHWQGPLWTFRRDRLVLATLAGRGAITTAVGVERIAREGDPLVVIMPADRLCEDDGPILEAVEVAIDTVRRTPDVVAVIGTLATSAEGEDYVRVRHQDAGRCARVERIVRSPLANTARALHRLGMPASTGIVIARGSTLLAQLAMRWPVLRRTAERPPRGEDDRIDVMRARMARTPVGPVRKSQLPFRATHVVIAAPCGFSSLRSPGALAQARLSAVDVHASGPRTAADGFAAGLAYDATRP